MKLPWQNDSQEKIQELEAKIEELKEEKESYRERFKAEKERRSKLSTEKQEAEEKLNRLKDKLEGLKQEENKEKEVETGKTEEISFKEAYSSLNKIDTIESSKEELVTVYCPGKFSGFSERKSLKNSIEKGKFEELQQRKSFAAFLDEELGAWMLETRPFFSEKLEISSDFEVSGLLEFIQKEKIWVLVSAGETEIFREEEGEFEEVETLKSRIEKKHSKGGFSQGRFERKREEQIEQHLDEVKEFVEGLEGDVYLLGESRLCEEIPGKRLGGFDPNKSGVERFYGFRFLRF
ncbi:MAG: Vms1/Ankzf1 family peptidyl-tRNA hydrolase [Candidatus Nanohalobium sp.]